MCQRSTLAEGALADTPVSTGPHRAHTARLALAAALYLLHLLLAPPALAAPIVLAFEGEVTLGGGREFDEGDPVHGTISLENTGDRIAASWKYAVELDITIGGVRFETYAPAAQNQLYVWFRNPGTEDAFITSNIGPAGSYPFWQIRRDGAHSEALVGLLFSLYAADDTAIPADGAPFSTVFDDYTSAHLNVAIEWDYQRRDWANTTLSSFHVVPEPSTALLVASGLLCLGWRDRLVG